MFKLWNLNVTVFAQSACKKWKLVSNITLPPNCWNCRKYQRYRGQTSSPTRDYYLLLGVPSNATKLEIKQKFYEKSKKLHPDKLQGSTKEDELEFITVKQAYEVLSNDGSRASYDQYRKSFNQQMYTFDEWTKVHHNYSYTTNPKYKARTYKSGPYYTHSTSHSTQYTDQNSGHYTVKNESKWNFSRDIIVVLLAGAVCVLIWNNEKQGVYRGEDRIYNVLQQKMRAQSHVPQQSEVKKTYAKLHANNDTLDQITLNVNIDTSGMQHTKGNPPINIETSTAKPTKLNIEIDAKGRNAKNVNPVTGCVSEDNDDENEGCNSAYHSKGNHENVESKPQNRRTPRKSDKIPSRCFNVGSLDDSLNDECLDIINKMNYPSFSTQKDTSESKSKIVIPKGKRKLKDDVLLPEDCLDCVQNEKIVGDDVKTHQNSSVVTKTKTDKPLKMLDKYTATESSENDPKSKDGKSSDSVVVFDCVSGCADQPRQTHHKNLSFTKLTKATVFSEIRATGRVSPDAMEIIKSQFSDDSAVQNTAVELTTWR